MAKRHHVHRPGRNRRADDRLRRDGQHRDLVDGHQVLAAARPAVRAALAGDRAAFDTAVAELIRTPPERATLLQLVGVTGSLGTQAAELVAADAPGAVFGEVANAFAGRFLASDLAPGPWLRHVAGQGELPAETDPGLPEELRANLARAASFCAQAGAALDLRPELVLTALTAAGVPDGTIYDPQIFAAPAGSLPQEVLSHYRDAPGQRYARERAQPAGPAAVPRSPFGAAAGPSEEAAIAAAWRRAGRLLHRGETHLGEECLLAGSLYGDWEVAKQLRAPAFRASERGEPVATLTARDVPWLRFWYAHQASQTVRLLRAGANASIADDLPTADRTTCELQLSAGLAVQAAVPFLVPADIAVDILDASPPARELRLETRLPADVCLVLFDRPLALPADLRPVTDAGRAAAGEHRTRLELLRARLATVPDWQRDPIATDNDALTQWWLDQPSLLESLAAPGAAVEGVVLFSRDQPASPGTSAPPRPEGLSPHVEDPVLWLVRAGWLPAPMDYLPVRGLLPASYAAADLAPLLDNLAALLCWGKFAPTPDTTDAARRGGVVDRRHGPRTSRTLSPVRELLVLPLPDDAPPPARAPNSAGQRSSPRPHRRKGHWRRVRVGPRDEWHYEGRFVPQTVVRPHAGELSPSAVYVLPCAPPDPPGE